MNTVPNGYDHPGADQIRSFRNVGQSFAAKNGIALDGQILIIGEKETEQKYRARQGQNGEIDIGIESFEFGTALD